MPATQLRQNVLPHVQRIVVKLGTQLLTNGQRELDSAYLADFARQVVEVQKLGKQVTLVSSGAIGAGRGELNLDRKPSDVAQQQAVAAVGQRKLMTCYHEAFKPHGVEVAQLLVTRSDFDDRLRFLNFRNCINAVHDYGCMPIINENDSVAVEEIRFGDNDMLAALVSNALRADLLVVLSVVDGLLDGAGQRVDLVEDMTAAQGLTKATRSSLGTGGMSTKLQAAGMVAEAGEVAVIANGRERNVLPRLLAGEPVGTVFAPAPRKLDSRKRWIGLTRRPAGTVRVDDGAAKALRQGGKSLLAIGITQVTGSFERGDVLAVHDANDQEIARGLSNYNAVELALIQGKRSTQFAKLLGHESFAEVIHCDNLVVTGARRG